MDEVTPLFEVDPSGGQVVVTRFECGTLGRLVLLLLVHARVKRDVRRHSSGLVASKVAVDWRGRVLLSISLWLAVESIYSMGGVPRHIEASRLPRRLGVRTTCGVFCFAGDWRRVMFRGSVDSRSPFVPTQL